MLAILRLGFDGAACCGDYVPHGLMLTQWYLFRLYDSCGLIVASLKLQWLDYFVDCVTFDAGLWAAQMHHVLFAQPLLAPPPGPHLPRISAVMRTR